MTFPTGVGSMPGNDQVGFDEAVRAVLGELTEPPALPFLPEVPGRGITAGMTGRALGLVPGLGVDLQPAGWRLTDASGVDHRRARSLLAQDLDALEEQAQGYAGPFKVQVAGPWTLAATVEKPRGDKVLSDHGARRDLAQALAEGVREHVRDVHRRVPGATNIVVQVDEPALTAVLNARVPTASGFGRHRRVDLPEASDTLGWVLAAAAEEGAEPWVHSCAPETPFGLLRGAGARGLVVDLDQVDAVGQDVLAEALDAGETVVLGVLPTTEATVVDGAVTERVGRWLEVVGLDPAALQLGISATCGLSGATSAWAARVLALARESATQLT